MEVRFFLGTLCKLKTTNCSILEVPSEVEGRRSRRMAGLPRVIEASGAGKPDIKVRFLSGAMAMAGRTKRSARKTTHKSTPLTNGRQ